MANTIQLAQKCQPMIAEVYRKDAVTAVLDSQSIDAAGANEVKILKVSTTGLGDYSRSEGYPKGDVTASWELLQLGQERGKEISVDRMDDEETLGLTFGAVIGQFIEEHVAPELDAYRFATTASAPGIQKATPGALTKDTILQAIDEAYRRLIEQGAPESGLRLFIASDLLPALGQAVTRTFGAESGYANRVDSYNGIPITYVPPQRFQTGIVLNDGESDWGFKKATGAKAINFLMLDPGAVLQVVKFSLPKIFTPDENQRMDAWLFQFREYHDAFVHPGKAKGIYLHSGV